MAQPNPKPLENHLQRISKMFISIEDEVNAAFRQHFVNISQYMVSRLKHVDNVFDKIFQKLQLAGSYADGIKVKAPNEFDVLVLIKFPKPNPLSSSTPGYVKINIKDGLNTWKEYIVGNEEKYKRFVDTEGYLIQHEILDWLRVLVKGILAEHRNIFVISGAEYHMQQRNCGPAVTIDVNVLRSPFGGIGKFSIDFVGALQFESNDKWLADKEPMIKVPRFWNAIPKPNKTVQQKNIDWICSYAEIERDYLNGLNRIKPLIKLFKKIRDKADLTNLKSYYIKTIFLHRRLVQPVKYWDGSLAVLFMEMFDVILEHLQTKTLWSLWHENYNLFYLLDDDQIDDIYRKLKNIRDKIVKNLIINNPDIIYDQILTSDEMKAMVVKETMIEKEAMIEKEIAEKVESQSWCTIM